MNNQERFFLIIGILGGIAIVTPSMIAGPVATIGALGLYFWKG